MKLNLMKADTYYGTNIDGINYRYGWYHSGRAFIAKEDEVMTFAEAYREFVGPNSIGFYDSFYGKETKQYYKKTIDGIVRYLIDTYNKD